MDLASSEAAWFQALLTSVQQTGPTRSTRRLSHAPAGESPVPLGPGDGRRNLNSLRQQHDTELALTRAKSLHRHHGT
jgi:hypothetical protein